MPDREPLTCRAAREWSSAFRDAEVGEDPGHLAHLEACPACRAWSAALQRLSAVEEATAASRRPDVVGPALAAWSSREEAQSARRERVGRIVLAAAGISGAVLSIAALVTLPAGGDHGLRDLLGFELVFAFGFLLCSRNPRRYGRALLPLTAAASVLILLPSAAETAARDLNPLAEASHLPVLIGLVGLLIVLDGIKSGSPGPGAPPGDLRTMSA